MVDALTVGDPTDASAGRAPAVREVDASVGGDVLSPASPPAGCEPNRGTSVRDALRDLTERPCGHRDEDACDACVVDPLVSPLGVHVSILAGQTLKRFVELLGYDLEDVESLSITADDELPDHARAYVAVAMYDGSPSTVRQHVVPFPVETAR